MIWSSCKSAYNIIYIGTAGAVEISEMQVELSAFVSRFPEMQEDIYADDCLK